MSYKITTARVEQSGNGVVKSSLFHGEVDDTGWVPGVPCLPTKRVGPCPLPNKHTAGEKKRKGGEGEKPNQTKKHQNLT